MGDCELTSNLIRRCTNVRTVHGEEIGVISQSIPRHFGFSSDGFSGYHFAGVEDRTAWEKYLE